MRKNKRIYITSAAILVIALLLIITLTRGGKKKAPDDPFGGVTDEISSVETEPSEPGEKRAGAIYFSSLNKREQSLYDAILKAARDVSEKTETLEGTFTSQRFEDIVNFVLADNPDLFYVAFGKLVLQDGGDKCYVDMKYCVDTEKIPDMKAELAAALTAAVTDGDFLLVESDAEKELALHDMLIAKCGAPEGDDPLFNTAYGALVMNEAYCDGYAYAMKLMLSRAGIEAYTVYGNANDADHAWNLVKIGGEYYHLDVLWDDANLSFPVNMEFHGYFNLSDKAISRDHTMTYPDLVPDASGEEDFYSLTGRKGKTLADMTAIFNKEIAAAVEEKREYIEVYCEETAESEALGEKLIPCIEAYNAEHGGVLIDLCHVYPASAVSNAVTVQLFYAEN